MQRATKAQRKAGGLRRGGDYEVEDVGDMYTAGAAGISVASDQESPEQSTEESSEEDGPVPSPATFAPPPRSASIAPAGVDGSVDDEELQEIQESIRSQLHEWANDPGMPLDEQKRCVRQLLAQWHPDKNQHIRTVATQIFQFIQEEVNRLVASLSAAADKVAKKDAELKERRAQRAAEKSAKAAALKSAREDKLRRKGQDEKSSGKPDPSGCEEIEDHEDRGEEFSLVVGHGPATTAYLRPWPRSHFSLLPSPVTTRDGEILLFGGEAYDGRELTFYSDLYRLNLHSAEAGKILPWEKLYSSVPLVPGPEARSSYQAVSWDKFFYIFGGEWSSRDQRRYRQFNDLWRFDTTGSPGTRWERLDAQDAPAPRSGHRMAVSSGGHAVVYGGFSEDKRRRATYLDDFYMLDLSSHRWQRVASAADRRAPRPGARAGGLLWIAGGATYIYGGTRTKKGSDRLEIFEDLWRAEPQVASSASADVSARWELLQPQGRGPGRRSGLSQCFVASDAPGRRLVFGGVLDVSVPGKKKSGSASTEVALYHNDVFLLDCEANDAPIWTQLWPVPGSGPAPVLDPAALPEELLNSGGGADMLAIVAAKSEGRKSFSEPLSSAPRGRIAAGCVVMGGALWVFGGSCESGPRREVTLDDLWRLELPASNSQAGYKAEWECILSLSERATMWFDSESDDESEEDEVPGAAMTQTLIAVNDRGGGVLSKKQQKEENKKARMEVKREKQQEKCEEKLSKRDQKKERQRAQAREKNA